MPLFFSSGNQVVIFSDQIAKEEDPKGIVQEIRTGFDRKPALSGGWQFPRPAKLWRLEIFKRVGGTGLEFHSLPRRCCQEGAGVVKSRAPVTPPLTVFWFP